MWCWNSLLLWSHKWNKFVGTHCTYESCRSTVQCSGTGKVLSGSRRAELGSLLQATRGACWQLTDESLAKQLTQLLAWNSAMRLYFQNWITLKIFKGKKKREVKRYWSWPGFFSFRCPEQLAVQWSLGIKCSLTILIRNPGKLPQIMSVRIRKTILILFCNYAARSKTLISITLKYKWDLIYLMEWVM